MSFQINIKHLEAGPRHYEGEIALDVLDIDTQDELVQAGTPLAYDVSAEQHEKNVLLTGTLRQTFACECARCLKSFEHPIELAGWSQLVAMEGEDALPIDNDCLDLTPILREDMLLSLPQHPLCAEECQGIAPMAGQKPASTEAFPETEASTSTWTALDQLRLD